MSESFVLTNYCQSTNLTHNILKFYAGNSAESYRVKNFQISIRLCNNDVIKVHAIYENSIDIFIIGTITNLSQLKKILLRFDTQVLLFDQSKIVSLLFYYFGKLALKMLEGKFVLINIKDENTIDIYTDSMGFIPVYYCIDRGGKLWVSSEIKSLFGIDEIDFTVKNTHELYKGKVPIDLFSSPYYKIKKLPAACQLHIMINQHSQYDFRISSYQQYNMIEEINISKEFAECMLDELINESILDSVSESAVAAVPLSGGLDSSLIAALVKNKTSKLHTVCIGTELNNEFSFAKKVSNCIGSIHHEILFSEKDFKKSLIQTIFYNEVFDALCIEIQLPFYTLYNYIKQYTTIAITGYGADMLFGGHFSPETDLSTINKLLYESLLKIQWRGEYAPFVGAKAGISVYHPFCVPKLVKFAMHLRTDLKIKHNRVKYILRELASTRKYLLPEICYREKIAIEVASSLNKYFSNYLNLSGNAYDKKNIFTHLIYRGLFQHQIAPDELNIDTYKDTFLKN